MTIAARTTSYDLTPRFGRAATRAFTRIAVRQGSVEESSSDILLAQLHVLSERLGVLDAAGALCTIQRKIIQEL